MNNELRLKEYQKKKFVKFLILFLSLVVVVLEVLAFFKVIHYIWGLLVFALVYLLKKILKENK